MLRLIFGMTEKEYRGSHMQLMLTVYIIFTALFGLAFGSFLNVCIYRLPSGESIVFGRSHCMACGKVIAERDLVPVFSYLVLRGRCRSCGKRISPRYPVIEALNAVLWVAAFLVFGMKTETIVYMAFISGLIVISVIDIDTSLIPNGIVIYLLVVGVLSCFFGGGVPLYEKIIGIAAGGLPLLLIVIASRGGMGGGDVEFAAVAGLLLGWKLAIFALFAAFIIGGLAGAVLMLVARRSGKTHMPFAPFLSLGMLAALFFGNNLIGLYLTAFHL
jgi:leader peptidase (prepilin peptidase)/N-methyltransferase